MHFECNIQERFIVVLMSNAGGAFTISSLIIDRLSACHQPAKVHVKTWEDETVSYETLNFEVADGVATITLSRPDNANALTKRMGEELFDVANTCDWQKDIRAVVVTATGKMFCAGGDLKEFNAQGQDIAAFLTATATPLHMAITRFQRMDAPVVMAVNGTAAGAGFSLALSGDFVMAVPEAKFVAAYTASGLTPDGSSTYFLAKHVGLMRAKELVLTNRTLSAEEAQQWGIVSRVVPADDLMAEAGKLAASFAAGPTKAYGGSKRLLLTAFNAALETQLEDETVSIAQTSRTEDGRHGIDAFANRNKPTFKGQ